MHVCVCLHTCIVSVHVCVSAYVYIVSVHVCVCGILCAGHAWLHVIDGAPTLLMTLNLTLSSSHSFWQSPSNAVCSPSTSALPTPLATN